MPKVSKRGGFSDRNKIKPVNAEIQLKDFDKRTRIQLQNMISEFYTIIYRNVYYSDDSVQDFCKYVIGTVYSEIVDSRQIYNDDIVFRMISKTIQDMSIMTVIIVNM